MALIRSGCSRSPRKRRLAYARSATGLDFVVGCQPRHLDRPLRSRRPIILTLSLGCSPTASFIAWMASPNCGSKIPRAVAAGGVVGRTPDDVRPTPGDRGRLSSWQGSHAVAL